MSSPFCRLPPELVSYILVLVHLHPPFFIPSSQSCRWRERPHRPRPVPHPTLPAIYSLATISRSIHAVAFSTPQLFTSLDLNLSVFPNTRSASNLYPYEGDVLTAAPAINDFFSRSGGSLPLTLKLRLTDWEEWYDSEHTVGRSFANRGVYLRSSPDSNDPVFVPLAFIYNSSPVRLPPEIPFSMDSMLSLRRQYFDTFTHAVRRFISEVILNPSFQGRWEVLELEVPVHFGFKDLLSSLVTSKGGWGAQNTPGWKFLRTLRLTATYEDSSLTPADGAGSFLFGGKSIQAPNLKDLRLDLRTAVKPTSIIPSTGFSPQPFSFDATSSFSSIQLTPPSSSIITRLRLDTYTTTPQLLFLLASASGLEMCDVRLHADVMEDEDLNALPPLVGQVPLPTPTAIWGTKPRGRALLPRLQYLAIRSAYHLNILNHLCAPILKGLYVEMDNDEEETDMEWWQEDCGQGVGGGNLDNEDHNAAHQVVIPTTHEYSTPARILEAFVHACSVTSSSSDLPTGIRYLKLVSVPISDSSLINVVRLTPQLRELRVWWGPSGRFIDELLPASVLRTTSGLIPVITQSNIQCLGHLRYIERHPNYPHQCYPRSRLQRATTLVPYLEYLYLNIPLRRRDQVAHLRLRLGRLYGTRKAASIEYAKYRDGMEWGGFFHDQATSESPPEPVGPLNFVRIRFNERDSQHLSLERMKTEMPQFECSM